MNLSTTREKLGHRVELWLTSWIDILDSLICISTLTLVYPTYGMQFRSYCIRRRIKLIKRNL